MTMVTTCINDNPVLSNVTAAYLSLHLSQLNTTHNSAATVNPPTQTLTLQQSDPYYIQLNA